MSPPAQPSAASRPLPYADPDALEAERAQVERAQAGDRRALGDLLERYGPILYRAVLLPRLGSVDAAEEALAVTYERIVEKIGQFVWQGRGIFPWLKIVALRIALDALRARRREVLYQPEDLEREIDRAERDAEGARGDAATANREDAEDARARLDAALEKLNPRYKLAIVRRVIEEKTREEVARELNVTMATFDVVLHRAMTALRKELDNASKAGER